MFCKGSGVHEKAVARAVGLRGAAAARGGAQCGGGGHDGCGHGGDPVRGKCGQPSADGVHAKDHDRARRARRGRPRPRVHGEKAVRGRGRLVDVPRRRRKADAARHALRPAALLGQRCGGGRGRRMRRRAGVCGQDECKGARARPDRHPLRKPERAAVGRPLHDRTRACEDHRRRAARPGVPRHRVDEDLHGRRPHARQPQPSAQSVRGRDRRQDRLHARCRALSGVGS